MREMTHRTAFKRNVIIIWKYRDKRRIEMQISTPNKGLPYEKVMTAKH